MIETTTTSNLNTMPVPEKEQQAVLLLSEIMDNSQVFAASAKDGHYLKTNTEYGVREELEAGAEQSSSETWLKITRALEHDPEFQLPGKFAETFIASANVPGIAQVRLMMVDNKMNFLEYDDPFTKKGEGGIEEAIELLKLAAEEVGFVKS